MKIFGGRGARSSGTTAAPKSPNANSFFANKGVRIVSIALASVILIVLGVAVWWNFGLKPVEIPGEVNGGDSQMQVNPTPDQQEPGSTVASNTQIQPQDALRKPGCYTILLAGTDADGIHTDTIMVAMLDTVNKTVDVVSVPRDTLVNVPRTVKKINSAYGVGETTGKGNGVLQLQAELQTVLGFKPDFYAIVKLKGFVKLIDAMGGVTFTVPVNMHKKLDDMTIDLDKGKQKLSGNQALQLVRFRDYPSQDLKRMEVQQQFLIAAVTQMMSIGNVSKIDDFAEIASENLETNMKSSDMVWFARELINWGIDSLEFHTLPNEIGTYHKGSYVFLKEEEAVKLINETINPNMKPITLADLDILHVTN